jgi:hypothetical protein
MNTLPPENITAPRGVTGDCTWELAGTPGDYTLVISGTGVMGNHDIDDPPPWHEYLDGITALDVREGVTTIGDTACRECENLVTATLPATLVTIGKLAFEHCTALYRVTFPPALRSIGFAAFSYCRWLHHVIIPDQVVEIGHYAFWHAGLYTLTLGRSLCSIGMGAFDACARLHVVTNLNPEPLYHFYHFFKPDGTSVGSTCMQTRCLRVPAGSESWYRRVGEWKNFGTIEAIPDEP